jgi:hypothetical protein
MRNIDEIPYERRSKRWRRKYLAGWLELFGNKSVIQVEQNLNIDLKASNLPLDERKNRSRLDQFEV